MIWRIVSKTDDGARVLADRHYSRQKPGTSIFTPPGRTLVLKAPSAYWVTSWPFAEYVMHRWAGAWVCSAFRREEGCPELASDLIRQAVAATRWYRTSNDQYSWIEEEPSLATATGITYSMVTFVDASKVRRKRDPGRCFLRAGFVRDGETEGGLLAFVLPADAMPGPEAPQEQGWLSALSKKEVARMLGSKT